MRLDRVAGGERARLPADAAELVASVSVAKREVLLRVYRRRLRREDLEDCYSQATLELLARARRGAVFESPHHISNALEQKFASRISDRHRAAGGRSATEAALANAVSLSDHQGAGVEVSDHGPSVADRVALRHELRRLREVADELTPDQRLVLVSQVSLGMDSTEFCRIHGWSGEKFRKVAQRARARLRTLTADYETGQRCRRLSEDLLAYAARVAGEEQADRVSRHLANCQACAARLRELDGSARHVAALLPVPAAGAGGLLAKVLAPAAAILHHVGHRLSPVRVPAGDSRLRGLIRPSALTARSPGLAPGSAGARGAAAGGGAVAGTGGSLLGLGATKISLTALCVAGAAGGYAVVCQREGWLPWNPGVEAHGVTARAHHRGRAGGDRHRRDAAPARVGALPMSLPPIGDRSTTGVGPAAGATKEVSPSPGAGGAASSVQREFGLQGMRGARAGRPRAGAGRRAARAARVRRAGRRRALAAGRAPGRTVAPRPRPRGGRGGSGEFLGGGRAPRGVARREFGF